MRRNHCPVSRGIGVQISAEYATWKKKRPAGVPVSMCGEMAGDPTLTRLLLGMGLRQFSMHPAQIPAVKQRIKQSDISELVPIVRRILRLEESSKIQEQIERLNLMQV